MRADEVNAILNSRRELVETSEVCVTRSPEAAEGGCGVLGFAANVPIAGRHIITASQQMHNRGNGKGGGIAEAGLGPAQMRVSPNLRQNEALFGIKVADLLRVDGKAQSPDKVYRKVEVKSLDVLH